MLVNGNPSEDFKNRLRLLAKDAKRILEIGTPCRFAKELRPYEKWFEHKDYVAAGYEPEPIFGSYNCDCHQDIENMSFSDGDFDAVICLEVLEHVKNPFHAASELVRVLRAGGKLLLTVPFLAQYHGKGGLSQSHGFYPDYWRFTHQGLEFMFRSMASIEVVPLDGPLEWRIKQAKLEPLLHLGPIRRIIDSTDKRIPGRATGRHMLFASK